MTKIFIIDFIKFLSYLSINILLLFICSLFICRYQIQTACNFDSALASFALPPTQALHCITLSTQLPADAWRRKRIKYEGKTANSTFWTLHWSDHLFIVRIVNTVPTLPIHYNLPTHHFPLTLLALLYLCTKLRLCPTDENPAWKRIFSWVRNTTDSQIHSLKRSLIQSKDSQHCAHTPHSL